LRIDLTYDGNGRIVSEVRYSDLDGAHQVGSSSYTYDQANRLIHLQQQDRSGNVLADYIYSYDAGGRLIAETDNGLTRYYVYDARSELTSDNATGVTYDLNGNRTNPGYITGKNNELLSDGTWNYQCDNEGNLIKKVRISDGLTWTYGYDLRNQMTFAEE